MIIAPQSECKLGSICNNTNFHFLRNFRTLLRNVFGRIDVEEKCLDLLMSIGWFDSFYQFDRTLESLLLENDTIMIKYEGAWQ